MGAGILGIAGLVILNIIAVAFSYGMLTQKVKDLCRRMGRVEDILNGKVASEEDGK